MSVRKDERAEGKLALSELAIRHTVYVIQITKNEKIFAPQYNDAITNDLVREAKNISHYIWAANNVLVNSKETYSIRRKYQELAATQCNVLLADINIARKLFHLSAKRMRYWTGMVIEIRNKTRGWISSDAKRYNQYRESIGV